MSVSKLFRSISATMAVVLCLASVPTTSVAQDRGRQTTSTSTRPSSATATVPESNDAEDEMAYTLRMGEAAPFAGTLFSVAAAARLLANLEFTQESCNLQISEKVRLSEANMQLRIDTEHARFEALQYRHTELMRIRNDQIQFLTAQYKPRSWYEKGDFWFGVGTVTGVLITVVAAYAIGLAN
jgi:hypothetical protein